MQSSWTSTQSTLPGSKIVVVVVAVVAVVEESVVVDVVVIVVLETVVVVFDVDVLVVRVVVVTVVTVVEESVVVVVDVVVIVVLEAVVVVFVVVISAILAGARVSPALSTCVQSSPDLSPDHPDDRQLKPMYKTVPSPYGAVHTPALRSVSARLVLAWRYRARAPCTLLAPSEVRDRNPQ